jgi:hypothetical protein
MSTSSAASTAVISSIVCPLRSEVTKLLCEESDRILFAQFLVALIRFGKRGELGANPFKNCDGVFHVLSSMSSRWFS